MYLSGLSLPVKTTCQPGYGFKTYGLIILDKSLSRKRSEKRSTYPIIGRVLFCCCRAILVLFVLPTFTSLYSQCWRQITDYDQTVIRRRLLGHQYGLIVLGL